MTLGAACSTAPVDESQPPPPADATTTVPATSTTSTVLVASDVADLVATTTMTDRGRRIFLAASPAIEDPATFGANCGVDSQSDTPGQPRTHTQGCYVAGRIHLLAPDRSEARDLLYVVAAHELLHAVYASLVPAERARIDAELDAARVGNARLAERLKPYGASPTLTNEIHSILGSEFDGLSPALEAHYAQFFANRAAVVAARQRTLGRREDEIAQLRADVDALDARISELKDTQEQLKGRSNFAAYNANVPVINGLIARYNAQIDTLNARIEEYNGLLGGG
jgi:hypothetical protein